MVTRRRPAPAHLASATLVAVAVAVLAVVLALADRSPEADLAAAPPAEPPAPIADPAPPPPDPVRGTVADVELVDLTTTGRRLYAEGHEADLAEEPDADEVAALVDAVAALLDAHLSDLQAGGDGELDTSHLVGPGHLLRLTDADHPVEDATYRLLVGARATPEWVDAHVTVTTTEGDERTAQLVFAPGEPPVLLGATGDGTAAATTTAAASAGPGTAGGGA